MKQAAVRVAAYYSHKLEVGIQCDQGVEHEGKVEDAHPTRLKQLYRPFWEGVHAPLKPIQSGVPLRFRYLALVPILLISYLLARLARAVPALTLSPGSARAPSGPGVGTCVRHSARRLYPWELWELMGGELICRGVLRGRTPVGTHTRAREARVAHLVVMGTPLSSC